MDLGTIKKKLAPERRVYNTLFQVADDIRLVWRNCMVYNGDGSDFFVLAKNLKREWERRFSKLLQDQSIIEAAPPVDDVGDDGNANQNAGQNATEKKITLEEKRSFAQHLLKLSKQDLSKVIVKVDQLCEVALIRSSTEDEFELHVDKVPSNVFQELVRFVEQIGSDAVEKKTGAKRKSNSVSSSDSTKRQKS